MTNKKLYLKTKDHSVSGEEFYLLYNESMDMLETSPKPIADKLPDYYKSENYISHTDSKRNLFEKVYQIVRNISLKKKLRLINSFSSDEKTLLDIGCGTGDFLKISKEDKWLVTGIEPNDEARTIANQKTNNRAHKNEYLLQLKENSFDVITLWHVLEHLPDLEEQIAVFKKLLKENGTLIIAVPNYKSFYAMYYNEFWAAYDVPRHLWHFSEKSMEKLFSQKSMHVLKTLPMKFDAFYVSLLSEKYKSGSMNIFNAFYVGLLSNIKAINTKQYSSLIYLIKNE